jgi:hypothetical protein
LCLDYIDDNEEATMTDKYVLNITPFEYALNPPILNADVTPVIERPRLIDIIKFAVTTNQGYDAEQMKLATTITKWIKEYSKTPNGWYFARFQFGGQHEDGHVQFSGYFKEKKEEVEMGGNVPRIVLADKKTLFTPTTVAGTLDANVMFGVGSK